jgi:digeranylgeranylglycerophospholipid reductase
MKWDAVIIGAGPAGCFTAMQIAPFDFKVLIIEEHEKIGCPVRCAGLISPRTMELAGVDKSIVINSVTGLQVFSPLGSSLHINKGSVIAQAINRTAFDQELAAKAENAGAVLLKGLKVNGLEHISEGYRLKAAGKNKNVTLDAKLIIGADGANSRVSKWLQLNHNIPKAVMYAADAELQCKETDLISIFLSQDFAPGWFGWIIPLDAKTCRVGTGFAFSQSKFSPKYFFQRLVNHYPQIFKDVRIIRYTGGTVPLGLMPKIYSPHAMLVGDAACQIKPISGGGLYFSLRGAQICGQIAVEALSAGDLSETRMACYQKLWEKEMAEEILCAMKHRESFLDFSDKDIDLLIRFLRKPQCEKIVIKYGDIDYPSNLAKKLLKLGPWKNSFFKTALRIADYAHLV